MMWGSMSWDEFWNALLIVLFVGLIYGLWCDMGDDHL